MCSGLRLASLSRFAACILELKVSALLLVPAMDAIAVGYVNRERGGQLTRQ